MKEKSIHKEIAKLIYNFYNNFWVELIGKVIFVILVILNYFFLLIGSKIRGYSKDFDKIEDFFLISEGIVLLSLYLLSNGRSTR